MPASSSSKVSAADPPGWLALLRGINVGGRNVVSMADLTRLFAEAGCKEVQTYIQSGNVLFSASSRVAKGVPESVSRLIAEKFDLRVPVIVRSADELRRVVATNPYLERGADPATLHLLFLAELPAPSRVASLDPVASPGESFVVRGREVFLHLPNGVARSKLSNAYFDSKLATTTTARNWRTVLALAQRLRVGAAP